MYTYTQPIEQSRRHQAASLGTALVRPAVELGKEFCLETSMHGFRHVAEPKRHWLERLLWVAATALAIWGAVDVSLGQLQRYRDSPTVVTVEKDFRSWRFSFPAVTACKKSRTDPAKLVEVIKNYWGVEPSDVKYEYYANFVRTVTDSNILDLSKYQEFIEDEDLNVNLYQLAVDVMPEVDIKVKISENVVLKWTPVMTEAGVCFTINSLAIDDVAIIKPNANDTEMYPIRCKYGGDACILMLEVGSLYDFYFHSPYDVVDMTQAGDDVEPGLVRTKELSVTETGCGGGVKSLSPASRNCLFTDEPESGKKVYSTNTCRLSCRSKVAVKLCKCRPFYYFYEDGPSCTAAGMACIAEKGQKLINYDNEKCSCSSQCLNSVFIGISTKNSRWSLGPLAQQGSIKYIVQPPKIRYTREIVFHFQDLVVSFGGAAGLFLGASFISFVEIFYFIIERILRAVSVNSQEQPENENPKKPTFEAQRVKVLTTILENNVFSHDYKRNGDYF